MYFYEPHHTLFNTTGGQIHNNTVYDTVSSGGTISVATGDGLDCVLTDWSSGDNIGWVRLYYGVQKLGNTTDRIYMLSTVSGISAITYADLTQYNYENRTDPVPDSTAYVYKVFPSPDYISWSGTDQSQNFIHYTRNYATVSSTEGVCYLDVTASGGFAGVSLGRFLKFPIKVSTKFKLNSSTTPGIGTNPIIFSPIYIGYSTSHLSPDSPGYPLCSISIFRYSSGGNTRKWRFQFTGASGSYYFNSWSFSPGEWVYDSTYSYLYDNVNLTQTYIAEVIIYGNGYADMWLKDQYGGVLEYARTDYPLSTLTDAWICCGNYSYTTLFSAEVNYFNVDHMYVGDVTSYNDMDVIQDGDDIYVAAGMSTPSGGVVVLKNEHLGWDNMQVAVLDPSSWYGNTTNVSIAGNDLYYIQTSGTGLDKKTRLFCDFNFSTSLDNYIMYDRYYSDLALPISSTVNAMVSYSGTCFSGIGNTIMMATDDDGAIILDQNVQDESASNFSVYGHENVIFLDSFKDDTYGESPRCWSVYYGDINNQSVRVVRSSEPKVMFSRTDAWATGHSYAWDSEKLVLIREYPSLYHWQDYAKQLRADDMYGWATWRRYNVHSTHPPPPIPLSHGGMVRMKKDSDGVDGFDMSASFVSRFGRVAAGDENYIQTSAFTIDASYVYAAADYTSVYSQVGGCVSTNFPVRIAKISRHSMECDWIEIPGMGYNNPYGYCYPPVIQYIHIDMEDDNIVWLGVSGILDGHGSTGMLHFVKFNKQTWEKIESYYSLLQGGSYMDYAAGIEIWEAGGYIWFMANKRIPAYPDDHIVYVFCRFHKDNPYGTFEESIELGGFSYTMTPSSFKFDDKHFYMTRYGASRFYVFKHNGSYSNPNSWPYIYFDIGTDDVLPWANDFLINCELWSFYYTTVSQDENSVYLHRKRGAFCATADNPPYKRIDKSDFLDKGYWKSMEGYDYYNNYGPDGNLYYGYHYATYFYGDPSGYEWQRRYGSIGQGKVCEIRDNSSSTSVSLRTTFKSDVGDDYSVKIRLKAYDTNGFRIKLGNNESTVVEISLSGTEGYFWDGLPIHCIKKRLPDGSFSNTTISATYNYGQWYDLKIDVYPSSDIWKLSIDGVECEPSGTFYQDSNMVDSVSFTTSPNSETCKVQLDNIVIYNPNDVYEEYSSKVDYPIMNGFTNRALSIRKTSNYVTEDEEAVIYCADPVFGGTTSQINLKNRALYAYYSTSSPFGPGEDVVRFVKPINYSMLPEQYRDQLCAGSDSGLYLFSKWHGNYHTSLSIKRLSFNYAHNVCYLATKGGVEVIYLSDQYNVPLWYHYSKGIEHIQSVDDGAFISTSCSGVYFLDRSDNLGKETPCEVNIDRFFSYGWNYNSSSQSREGLLNNKVNYIYSTSDSQYVFVSTESGVDFITTDTPSGSPFDYVRYSCSNISGSDVCYITSTGDLYWNIRGVGLAVKYGTPSGASVSGQDLVTITGTTTTGIYLGHPDYLCTMPSGTASDQHGEYIIGYLPSYYWNPNAGPILRYKYPLYKVSVQAKRVGIPEDLVVSVWSGTETTHVPYYIGAGGWPPSILVTTGSAAASTVPTGSYGWVDVLLSNPIYPVSGTEDIYVSLSIANYITSSGNYYLIAGWRDTSIDNIWYDQVKKSYCSFHTGPYAVYPTEWWGHDFYYNFPGFSSGTWPSFNWLLRYNIKASFATGYSGTQFLPDYVYNFTSYDFRDIYVLEGMSMYGGGSNRVFIATSSGMIDFHEYRGIEASGSYKTYGPDTSLAYDYNILKGSTDNVSSVFSFLPEGNFYTTSDDGIEGGAFTAVQLSDPFVWDYMTVESGGGLVSSSAILPTNNMTDTEVIYFQRWKTTGD